MSNDEKTRLKGKAPESGSSNTGPEDEAARREAAARKAMALEQRLAQIQAQKSSQPPVPENRTQIAPARQEGGDRTVFKPRTPEPEAASADATQFKPRRRDLSQQSQQDPAQNRELDLGSNEPTAVNITAPSVPTSGGFTPVDLSQYSGRDILKNRFVFEKILGAGGMGVVYKAKDLLKVEAQDRDPFVAIKVLGEEFKSHPEAFIALQRESRKTQRIAHPNIVNVHDFDRDGDTVFMTMEYLEGKPLDKFISQYKSTGLPEEDAWKILQGISSALIYAHEQSIIHSDFKPGNIFVTNSGLAKVFDFGIARAVAKAEKFEESVDDRTIFDAGNLGALTPAYASLEMLEGETPDVRDDIYALGCIAYEMFTGNHPFDRVHADEAMRKKLKPKRITNITKRQWRVIEKALAFKREDRIETVQEFWRLLNSKRSTRGIALVGAAALAAVVSVLVYQRYYAPVPQEFDPSKMRSEVEREFYIGRYKQELEGLLANPEFSANWEERTWQTLQNLQTLLGEADPWWQSQREVILALYLEKIPGLIEKNQFDDARRLVSHAPRYGDAQTQLAEFEAQIDAAERALAQSEAEANRAAEQARKQQQSAAAQRQSIQERDRAFDVAMTTVNKQLQCRTTVNMSDLDIAVNKLRSLNPREYQKSESSIVNRLAACLEKIGQSFPDRAVEFQKRALRIFPNNTTLAGIKIEPKDPCDKSLAGLGARGKRAICRDTLRNESSSLGRGPALVVIPGRGSVKTFAIGKYEVSVDEFNLYCESSKKCSPRGGDGRLPVTGLDAAAARGYASWLSSITKRKYRLPSRAEWVYAARAKGGRPDPNRNCRLESRGIKKGDSLVSAATGQQNGWGLVNHLGNVGEIVLDGGGYAAAGGSFRTPMEECVETGKIAFSNSNSVTGFRLLRELEN